ncbi:hypothetical protein KL909_005444 [Ogataea angusta]|nr:hypothetical protein KL909_005444 [Ogataea angusta]
MRGPGRILEGLGRPARSQRPRRFPESARKVLDAAACAAEEQRIPDDAKQVQEYDQRPPDSGLVRYSGRQNENSARKHVAGDCQILRLQRSVAKVAL